MVRRQWLCKPTSLSKPNGRRADSTSDLVRQITPYKARVLLKPDLKPGNLYGPEVEVFTLARGHWYSFSNWVLEIMALVSEAKTVPSHHHNPCHPQERVKKE
ncbi:hypothetical protein AVEN_149312-1 [Araneus ventricosus]|uniref:Uncharacterized protein n=1 Tax=Araneus ventricosus TaxID=182803 RepID=A0A4Y2WWH9_ARAVE|nr:hypothetical protein AVEN_149312-1 [Araneus ventricosus]